MTLKPNCVGCGGKTPKIRSLVRNSIVSDQKDAVFHPRGIDNNYEEFAGQ